ncbi:hypothetical protein AVEN_96642-1 [Araneus ventricosus]|uniref:Uncharacterized protein n=1 Tax=Araneus ventricosus TaxID=182803 RepID=A0A4Y2E7C9_ARAVE|nr:hypothetical protein AVEN_96642-1 [Araneus ventricosus]
MGDQLAELSKLAGIEYDPESFQHEAAVECFDDYSADLEERLLVNESAEGSNSVSDEEFSDAVCNRQQAKISTHATLGKIEELIGNSDAVTNESVRNLLLKLKNELERKVVFEKVVGNDCAGIKVQMHLLSTSLNRKKVRIIRSRARNISKGFANSICNVKR